MESQVTIFWEWLQLFPCLMIDCTSDISRKHITMWMIISKRFTKPMRLCGYVGEIGDAYAQLDGRPTILTQSFLFNCFLAKLGLVHRMAVPYVYWSVPRSWVQLTQYTQVLTSTAPYWPSTTMYQLVLPSIDLVPPSTNNYHCHGQTSTNDKPQTMTNDIQRLRTNNNKQRLTTNNN